MAIKQVFYLFCDKCGCKLIDSNGNTVYNTWWKGIVDEAIKHGWAKQGDKNVCKNCLSATKGKGNN